MSLAADGVVAGAGVTAGGVRTASGTFDGQVALDGKAGDSSPYAKVLVKHLAEPGLELGVFFRRVRAEVLADTGGKQRPLEYGSVTSEDLFFRPATR